MLTKAFIPYRGYYSTPFARWQGTMANEHSIILAAGTSRRWFSEKNWDPAMIDYLFLGITIGQPQWFYGSPWAAALLGAESTPGTIVSQACTTSATCIFQAGVGIETGFFKNAYCLMTDRCSNGPHTVWPNPLGPGGEVISENWLMDNFNRDPWAKGAMIQTAENVAREEGFTRKQCDALTLRRYEQYRDALDNDRAFQKRYMFPAEVKVSKKKTLLMEADEGIVECSAEGLAGLSPVLPDGVHTFGSQTHPADGNCAVMVTSREKAKELSADGQVEIQIVSYGYARTKKGFMAKAVVPAVEMAMDRAGIGIKDVAVIKTHNPFAVNDLYLAQQLGIDENRINNYGSSLIFGHPQAPTAGRCIIEGIEETVMAGGGYLLWGGCAAGDTAAALVLKIG
ncbi:MAG: thiolase family protein [Deltaproteobacteria bacterium]|nr:thiolase family protein [Deltaproteobacteria bacterium]MBW1960695.1 thiolase family protein [Deltaproteobacteria bacterium]MBW2151960.1 thiolase family protein [Deltaproteobacteria bacterium]